MTPEQTRELAGLVVKEMGLAHWAWAILVLICSAVGSYFGAYLKKRAENKAAKDDLALIKEQLRETTTVAEQIKRSVTDRGWLAQQRWGRREAQYMAVLKACADYEVGMLDAATLLKNVEDRGEKPTEEFMNKHVEMLMNVYRVFTVAELFIDLLSLPEVEKFMSHEDISGESGGVISSEMLFANSEKSARARVAITNLGREELVKLEAGEAPG